MPKIMLAQSTRAYSYPVPSRLSESSVAEKNARGDGMDERRETFSFFFLLLITPRTPLDRASLLPRLSPARVSRFLPRETTGDESGRTPI